MRTRGPSRRLEPQPRCVRSPYIGRDCRRGARGCSARRGTHVDRLRQACEKSGCAKSALQAVVVLECLLHRAETISRRYAFDRRYIGAVELRGERDARPHWCSVQEDGARAADPLLAADMSSGMPEFLPQQVGGEKSSLDRSPNRLAVHCAFDLESVEWLINRSHLATSASARDTSALMTRHR